MNCPRYLITRKKTGEFMAKNISNQVHMEQPEQKPGFFQKLFFWFIIPLVFCLAILLVITMFTEKNVFDYIEELPFMTSRDDADNIVQQAEQAEQKLVSVQAELNQKEAEIADLQAKFDAKIEENQQLQIKIEQLQYEIEKLKVSQEQSKKEFNEIVSTFDKMSAKKAAPILVQMDEAEALRILSSLKPDRVKDIFEKMSPQDAAKFTQLLTR